jgi:crotonobetainyl-CoA:carnitine CoA-transferase CaiB-like acyl-CoA transferase
MVQVLGRDMFERWTSAVDAVDLRDDPRFATDMSRGEHGEALSARMAAWCRERTTTECLAALRAARVPACPVLSPREALDNGHIREGGFFQWFRYDNDGPDLPLVSRLVSTDSIQDALPAPRLGADTMSILMELGLDAGQVEKLHAQGSVYCAPPIEPRSH